MRTSAACLLFLFTMKIWAGAEVAAPQGPTSSNSDELKYEVEAIKKCIADNAPPNKKPKEYITRTILKDNGECEIGAANTFKGENAPAFRTVAADELPKVTATPEDFKNLKLALESQIKACEDSGKL